MWSLCSFYCFNLIREQENKKTVTRRTRGIYHEGNKLKLVTDMDERTKCVIPCVWVCFQQIYSSRSRLEAGGNFSPLCVEGWWSSEWRVLRGSRWGVAGMCQQKQEQFSPQKFDLCTNWFMFNRTFQTKKKQKTLQFLWHPVSNVWFVVHQPPSLHSPIYSRRLEQK